MLINIVKPYFSAYITYGWDKKVPGIGVKKELVEKALRLEEKLEFTIGKDPTVYEISPITIMNLVKKYNSRYKARYNVDLLVFPQNRLEKKKVPEPPVDFGLFSLPDREAPKAVDTNDFKESIGDLG